MSIIGFKEARGKIITLLIHRNAITNLTRKNVVDKQYAKFRTNTAKVISIRDPHTLKECDYVSSNRDNYFYYVKGKTITEGNYDMENENVCTRGIHFYLSYGAALGNMNEGLCNIVNNEGEIIGKKIHQDSGKILKIVSFSEKGKEETISIYDENGIINRECRIIKGRFTEKRDGISIQRINGNLEHVDEWIEGIHFNHFMKFSNNVTGDFENGKREGVHRIITHDGQILMEGTWKNDIVNGPHKIWYSNGALRESSNWIEGCKVGLFMKWYYDGEIMEESNWDCNKRNGLTRKWYNNKLKCEEGMWLNGEKIGSYFKWHPNGKLKTISKWNEGVKNGKKTIFDIDGHTKTIEEWDNGTLIGKKNMGFKCWNFWEILGILFIFINPLILILIYQAFSDIVCNNEETSVLRYNTEGFFV
jgi:antitoxin component YwqK of YwqJK toxin-antitoxin module